MRFLRSAAIWLLGVAGLAAAPLAEERVEHAGARFRVARAEAGQVRVFWKDHADRPLRTFDQVRAALAQQGKSPALLMNGGIFEPGGIPTGLHIEEGRTLRPINLADAPGNFFLKPNGVFLIHGDKAAVIRADAFVSVKRPQKDIRVAVQSGPMLLIAGRRHPAFKEGSPNKLHRNGVGVDDKGRVVFAITDRGQDVNLWDFAGLFLKLGCRDALFLDGDISQMAVHPAAPVESNRFGAILAVVP